MSNAESQSIILQVLPTDSLLDLLIRLDELFQTEKKLQIDLRGTPYILVQSIACVHCGKFFPIHTPLSSYREEAFRCERCADICEHTYEAYLPAIKTITQYSFRTSKRILGLSLERLGLLSNAPLSVIDRFGTAHSVILNV